MQGGYVLNSTPKHLHTCTDTVPIVKTIKNKEDSAYMYMVEFIPKKTVIITNGIALSPFKEANVSQVRFQVLGVLWGEGEGGQPGGT